MTYSNCSNTYTNTDTSPNMVLYDWWDIPGSIYSLRQSIIGCDETPDATILVYKNSRGTYLGSTTWSQSAPVSFDEGGICVDAWGLDCVLELTVWVVYFGLTNLNNVYVNSSTGNDSNAGSSSSVPVLTFQAAYTKVADGGTIHVCNSGADFSAETVTLNKSFSIDLNGGTGNFYMPQAS